MYHFKKPRLILSITVLLFSLPRSGILGQSKYTVVGSNEAVVFEIRIGTFTANHVGKEFGPDVVDKNADIQFKFTDNSDRSYFDLGNQLPDHFIDRRGNWHQIKSSDLNAHEWSIDGFRFFPGESGSPIFGKDGKVCGVVLGNYLNQKSKRWFGRVGKIQGSRRVIDQIQRLRDEQNKNRFTQTVEAVFE